MPNTLTDLYNTVRTRIKDFVQDGIPVATLYDNDPTPIPNDVEFVRASIRFIDTAQQVTVGGITTVFRYEGLVLFQIFGKHNAGDASILLIADEIFNNFRSVIADGIVWRVPSAPLLTQRTGNTWQININAPFHSDFIS